MGIKELFEILARYLDFLVNFIIFQGMEKYAKLGSISSDLVAFFSAGLLIAYLVSSMKAFPGYYTVPGATNVETTKSDEQFEKKFTTHMAQFAIVSIVGIFFFHGFLIMYRSIFGVPTMSSVSDTLNAVFAYNALYHPYNALAKQFARWLSALSGLGRGGAAMAAVMFLALSICELGILAYLLYSLAAVHEASIGSMLLAAIVFVVLFFVLYVLFFRALGLRAKTSLGALFLRDVGQQ